MTPEQQFAITQVFIISYPKTGRTWLRVLIGRYLCTLHGLDQGNIERTPAVTKASGLLLTRFTHEQAGFLASTDYRALRPDRRRFRGKKVLLLGRDARDTLVSAYFWAKARLKIFDGSISDFVRDGTLGAPKFFTFYRHWLAARDVLQDLMLLRYEELHRDPEASLARVLGFLGAERIDAAALRDAVAYASFDNLRRVEAADPGSLTALPEFAAAEAAPTGSPEGAKFRRGKVGAFTEHLSAEDIAWIDAANAEFGCEFTRT